MTGYWLKDSQRFEVIVLRMGGKLYTVLLGHVVSNLNLIRKIALVMATETGSTGQLEIKGVE